MTVDPLVGSKPAVSPDQFYAKPRPLMRGPYLVRSHKAVFILRTVDALLHLLTSRQKPHMLPSKPKRILISNWAHLGDVITSLPTLRALRERFPDATIDLMVGPGGRVAVEGSGLYNRLYSVDHFSMSRTKRSLPSRIKTYLADRRKFLAAARLENYEIGIDLYPHFPPAAPLFRQAGIPVRCGFTSGGFGPLLTHPVRWSYQERPIGQHGRELISALWPDLAKSLGWLQPYYPGGPHLKLPAHMMPTDPRYVVVHMGAGERWKEWPDFEWCRLIQIWGYNAPCLVFCGTGVREAVRANRVAEQSPTGRTFLFIDRKWDEFVALVAGAAGLVCLESSACHVAAAFSVPTVAIYSGTNEHRLWGPDNPNARILSTPTGCAPCHRAGCGTMACVRGVSAEDVLAALRLVMRDDSRVGNKAVNDAQVTH